ALTTTVALTSCDKDEDPEPTPATKTTMTMSKVGQFYHVAGLEKGAYNLVEDKEMGALETNSAKDMVNIDTAGGVFTGSWSVGTGNTTMFVKSNAFDYANATVEAADSAYSAGTATATVNDPAVNDIYIA